MGILFFTQKRKVKRLQSKSNASFRNFLCFLQVFLKNHCQFFNWNNLFFKQNCKDFENRFCEHCNLRASIAREIPKNNKIVVVLFGRFNSFPVEVFKSFSFYEFLENSCPFFLLRLGRRWQFFENNLIFSVRFHELRLKCGKIKIIRDFALIDEVRMGWVVNSYWMRTICKKRNYHTIYYKNTKN